MTLNRKSILIKVTSSLGRSMSSNAEYHTLYYFCKWLSEENNVIVSGIEYDSPIIKELERLNVKIKKPFFKYLFIKKLAPFLHIPISIVNTFIDALIFKPSILFCLGGVFYNGLGIVIAGKLLGLNSIVRSAEDHIGIANFESKYFFNGLYAKLRALISGFVIKNSDYFLTLGEWSINYFRKKYNLSEAKSFVAAGPIDNSICFQKSFFLTKEKSKKNLKKIFKLPNGEKTILFVGSRNYKGTENLLLLIQKLKQFDLPINILWISKSIETKSKISTLKLNKFVNFIDPLNREDLVAIIKGVDFLYWSTNLGVGYGQIMLESILCNTEIICYKPIGDARYLVKNQFYTDIDMVIDRLKNNIPPKNIKIPKFMKEEIIKEKHIQIFRQILAN